MKCDISLVSIIFCFTLFASTSARAQNAEPLISNLSIQTIGNDQLQITYDLSDSDNDDIDIKLKVSEDGGKSYRINTSGATGDVGYPIQVGAGKVINWDFSTQIQNSGSYRIMLVADDQYAIDIQSIVDQVDSNRLRTALETIEGIRHRTANPSHLEEVKTLIKDRFSDAQLELENQSFMYGGYEAENIIGRKAGLSEDSLFFVIDGHYDGVDDSPAADDNGSAVAGVLEALRVLSPYQFNKSIKFIGFDLEEEGLVGSIRYVSEGGYADHEEVAGVFNFEMIGYSSSEINSQSLPTGFNFLYPDAYQEIQDNQFRGDFIINIGLEGHTDIPDAFVAAASNYVPDLKVISILAPSNWRILTPDFGRSDHAPFWVQDKPAIMLTDGANFRNPNYHTPNDTSGSLNYTFMSHVVKATVGAVAEMAGLCHCTSESFDIDITTSTVSQNPCIPDVTYNPNFETLNINLDKCQFPNAVIQIYNVEGQRIYSLDRRTSMTGDFQISTSNFTTGVYVIDIRSENQIYSTKFLLGH